MRRIVLLILLTGLALLTGGCVSLKDPEASQEYRAEVVGTVDGAQSVGQTFVSRRAGLNGVQVWLRVDSGSSDANGSVTIELFHQPGEARPLVSQTIPISSIEQETLSIPFDPQPDPPSQAYYLRFKTDGAVLHALGRAEDAYPKGHALIQEQAVEADLGFRASYDYNLTAVLQDIWSALQKSWLIIPLLLTLWLPGRLLLRLAGWDERLDFGERAATSVGLSMAVIPLTMLWTTALNLSWNRTGVWVVFILLTTFYVFLLLHNQTRTSPARGLLTGLRRLVRTPRSLIVSPVALCLAAIFLFSLAVRLGMVRDLAAPAWVDSVHHATLIRLILEQGALPASYQPYLNLDTASYHPGFHSLTAVFIWLSGLELSQALLLFGQVLNALAVMAVYLLTTTFTRDPVSGLVAALVTGLVTPMPAYYASWGRYTQLAGLLILPVAFYFVQHWLDVTRERGLRLLLKPGNRAALSSLLLIIIACGGLFLTHYRVIIYLACLILAYITANLIQSSLQRDARRTLWIALGATALAVAFSILATLPWWPSALRSFFLPAISLTGSQAPFFDFSWALLNAGLGRYALGLAALGLIWAAIQRRWFSLVLSLWVALMLLTANLSAFSLPGAALMNNTSVVIMLFMPISVACGYLFGWVLNGWRRLVPKRWQPAYWTGLLLAAAALACLGARSILPMMNPATLLFRQADRPAMDWIADNIPPGETILINPFLWGYGLYAGGDGGSWIPPLAGHPTSPPPVLYGMDFGRPSIQQVSEFNRQALDLAGDPTTLWALLHGNNIHYIYLGARGGVFSPQNLRQNGQYRVLYQGEGTWLFEALPEQE